MCDKHYRTYLVILNEKAKGFLQNQGEVPQWQQYNFLSKEEILLYVIVIRNSTS